ncbi:MAG: hypothetical protein CM1200mP2_57240 [Planctomycetaceae bacterium]|nr:MAG: hypothetical protein CM1200mP2_57240 [Planctomycetaceae bacterium]
MNFTRRRFLTGSLAGIAGATGPFPVLPTVHAASRRRRLKIAAVTTIYFKYSHAQHIVDRFLEGRLGGETPSPDMDVVPCTSKKSGRTT